MLSEALGLLQYSQESLTHGAGVAVHFPIWALDGVILSGAKELTILPGLTVFITQLLCKWESVVVYFRIIFSFGGTDIFK